MGSLRYRKHSDFFYRHWRGQQWLVRYPAIWLKWSPAEMGIDCCGIGCFRRLFWREVRSQWILGIGYGIETSQGKLLHRLYIFTYPGWLVSRCWTDEQHLRQIIEGIENNPKDVPAVRYWPLTSTPSDAWVIRFGIHLISQDWCE